jgi:hypothetical protein
MIAAITPACKPDQPHRGQKLRAEAEGHKAYQSEPERERVVVGDLVLLLAAAYQASNATDSGNWRYWQ